MNSAVALAGLFVAGALSMGAVAPAVASPSSATSGVAGTVSTDHGTGERLHGSDVLEKASAIVRLQPQETRDEWISGVSERKFKFSHLDPSHLPEGVTAVVVDLVGSGRAGGPHHVSVRLTNTADAEVSVDLSKVVVFK